MKAIFPPWSGHPPLSVALQGEQPIHTATLWFNCTVKDDWLSPSASAGLSTSRPPVVHSFTQEMVGKEAKWTAGIFLLQQCFSFISMYQYSNVEWIGLWYRGYAMHFHKGLCPSDGTESVFSRTHNSSAFYFCFRVVSQKLLETVDIFPGWSNPKFEPMGIWYIKKKHSG